MNKFKNKDLKKYKKTFSYSYTLGVFPTLEILKTKSKYVLKIFISETGLENSGVKKIIALSKQLDIPLEVNDKILNKISNKDNTYALAVFSKYKDTIKNGNHVVLVNPQDMGNLGTIVRTCLGFGVENLSIISPGVDIFDPKVIRASMGAIFNIKIEYFENFEKYSDKFPNNKKFSLMLNSNSYLHEIEKAPENFSLIFGSESSGLDEEYFSKVSQGIKIKQNENIDSFNLSIAVGITLYQFRKNIID